MEIYIQDQLILLLYAVIAGLIFGAGYDIIRIIHIMSENFRFKKLLIFCLDLIYMALLTVCYSIFIYAFHNGIHRMFIVAPITLGFMAYHYSIGRIVIHFSNKIIKFIRTAIRYLFFIPLRFIVRAITYVLRRLYRSSLYILILKAVDFQRMLYTAVQKKQIKKWIRI